MVTRVANERFLIVSTFFVKGFSVKTHVLEVKERLQDAEKRENWGLALDTIFCKKKKKHFSRTGSPSY